MADRVARWRESVSLGRYIATFVVAAIAGSSGLVAFYAFRLQYDQALEASWAISYLEGEKLAQALGRRLEAGRLNGGTPSSEGDAARVRAPDAIFEIQGAQRAVPRALSGAVSGFTAADVGLRSLQFKDAVTVLALPEGTFAFEPKDAARLNKRYGLKLAPGGLYVAATRFQPEGEWRGLVGPADRDEVVYVANTNGQLLFTTDPLDVTEAGLLQRPLVRRFATSSIATAQVEVDPGLGENRFGFFVPIRRTNLVLFSEIPRSAVFASTRSAALRFGVFFIVIVTLTLIIIQMPLASVAKPIHEVTRLAGQIARGDFKVAVTHYGFGEMAVLSRSFASMAGALQDRDRAINSLLIEQKKKVEIVRELEVAKSLQDNLLPTRALAPESGVELAAVYVPATFVAGDWFTYDFNERTGETIVAVADVTGHDVAASMFTAMIAALFLEVRASSGDRPFPMRHFAEIANRGIAHFGRGRWGATMVVASMTRGSRAVSLMNCGHVFPLLAAPPAPAPTLLDRVASRAKAKVKARTRSRSVRMPSSPIGYGENVSISQQTIELAPDETLILFSDGVTEARRPDGTVFGTRRFVDSLDRVAGGKLEMIVAAVKEDCDSFREGREASDDLCLIALRIPA